jgi:sugar phosphate isomerase/epimerase
MDRRKFLIASAAAAALPSWAAAQSRNIGLQLYTVRNELTKDFQATLNAIARIGYREVELAGFLDVAPGAIRAMLDHAGLTAPSAHFEYAALRDGWAMVLSAAEKLGLKFIVCPWVEEGLRRDLENWKRVAQTFNLVGEQSRRAGLQFAYHNHDFEFRQVDGKLLYDVLLAETDPALVKMELDVYWITRGGQDPLGYFARFPGRFRLLHLKDMDRAGAITDVGRGVIDFAKILAQSAIAGVMHSFVEHDDPPAPLESARRSFEYLSQLRF